MITSLVANRNMDSLLPLLNKKKRNTKYTVRYPNNETVKESTGYAKERVHRVFAADKRAMYRIYRVRQNIYFHSSRNISSHTPDEIFIKWPEPTWRAKQSWIWRDTFISNESSLEFALFSYHTSYNICLFPCVDFKDYMDMYLLLGVLTAFCFL